MYYDFIKTHPYKPKERRDINIRGFVIETLKSGMNVEEMCAKYQIGRRTIGRKIIGLKKSDKEEDRRLYELYKRIAYKKSHSKEFSYEDIMQINELQVEEVTGIDNVERRRQELLELEKRYQDLCLQVGKEAAAKKLGYTQNRIYKLLNELYRIEIERNIRKKAQVNTGKNYRDSMRVEGIRNLSHTNPEEKDNNIKKNTEQKEK